MHPDFKRHTIADIYASAHLAHVHDLLQDDDAAIWQQVITGFFIFEKQDGTFTVLVLQHEKNHPTLDAAIADLSAQTNGLDPASL